MTKQSVAALLTIMIAVMSTCRAPMGTERKPQVSNVDMVGKGLSFSAASRKWPRLAQKQNQLVPGWTQLVPQFSSSAPLASLLSSSCVLLHVLISLSRRRGSDRKKSCWCQLWQERGHQCKPTLTPLEQQRKA